MYSPDLPAVLLILQTASVIAAATRRPWSTLIYSLINLTKADAGQEDDPEDSFLSRVDLCLVDSSVVVVTVKSLTQFDSETQRENAQCGNTQHENHWQRDKHQRVPFHPAIHAVHHCNWAFTRSDRRTDQSVRRSDRVNAHWVSLLTGTYLLSGRLHVPTVCPTGRTKRLHDTIVGPTGRSDDRTV